jgi:hypothetical protein
MPNRVMSLNSNPDARGFIVRVLEEVSRDMFGNIKFQTIASETASTRKTADKAYDRLRATYVTGA